MMQAKLLGNGLHENIIFDASGERNRDDCCVPYALLKKKFYEANISINTPDIAGSENSIFEIHMDISATVKKGCYVLLLETAFIHPPNGNYQLINQYEKIFTWNDDLVDGVKFIKINFPNPVSIPAVDGFSSRNMFCCMIAGNKKAAVKTNLDLYSERVKVIRWFEKNAPLDFDLYGQGWDKLSPTEGPTWKPLRKRWLSLKKRFDPCAFPSYKGSIPLKRAVLEKTKFNVCYENVKDMPGYITEKIFDSFFSGCIPVYWGANNIASYIPTNCFIDRRNFIDTADMYKYLKSITETQFMEYQNNIVDFLNSNRAYPFTSEFFVETIFNVIMADINADG